MHVNWGKDQEQHSLMSEKDIWTSGQSGFLVGGMHVDESFYRCVGCVWLAEMIDNSVSGPFQFLPSAYRSAHASKVQLLFQGSRSRDRLDVKMVPNATIKGLDEKKNGEITNPQANGGVGPSRGSGEGDFPSSMCLRLWFFIFLMILHSLQWLTEKKKT